MGGHILTRTKAKYVGGWDPEYQPGKIYEISALPEYPGGEKVAAYNSHGEAYVIPARLFEPVKN